MGVESRVSGMKSVLTVESGCCRSEQLIPLLFFLL
jgi:hypothetical protein